MKKAILLLLVVLFPWGASHLFHRMGFQFDAIGEKLLWSSRELRRNVWADLTPPADWREDSYLALNPDVAARVREGLFFNGYEHYLKHGKAEGRRGGFPDPQPPAPPPPAPEVAQAPPPPPPQPAPPRVAAVPAKPAPEPPPVQAPTVQPATVTTAPRPPASDPPAPAGHYVVRNGGALAKVAEVTGIPLAELKAANPDLPGWLPPGTAVRLPEGSPAAAPPAPVPVAAAPPPPPPLPVPSAKPTATSAVPSVGAVRFGQHGEQVRVVLDTSAPVNFRYAVQNDRKTIVIELPGTGWNAARAWKAGEGALFNSFQADTGVSGSRLVLRAGRDVEVKQAALFPPAGERGHRIVMDVSAAKGVSSR